MIEHIKNQLLSVTENMEIKLTFDYDVIERDGKQCLNVKGVHSKAKFEDYSTKFKSDTVTPFVIKAINYVANVNRKLIFSEIEPEFMNILRESAQVIVTPILNQIVIQDLFQENCK